MISAIPHHPSTLSLPFPLSSLVKCASVLYGFYMFGYPGPNYIAGGIRPVHWMKVPAMQELRPPSPPFDMRFVLFSPAAAIRSGLHG